MCVFLCVCLQDLVPLEEKLQQLKDKAAAKGPEGGAGPTGDRLAKLKQDAGDLANTTDTMTEALEGTVECWKVTSTFTQVPCTEH